MTNTYNRGRLKREIIKGEWTVKRNYKYTDDYAWDAATDYGKTDYMKAAYFPDFWLWLEEGGKKEEYNTKLINANAKEEWEEVNSIRREYSKQYLTEQEKATKGKMVFDQGDFRGYGSAWSEEDGTVTLYFGYTSYKFKKA